MLDLPHTNKNRIRWLRRLRSCRHRCRCIDPRNRTIRLRPRRPHKCLHKRPRHPTGCRRNRSRLQAGSHIHIRKSPQVHCRCRTRPTLQRSRPHRRTHHRRLHRQRSHRHTPPKHRVGCHRSRNLLLQCRRHRTHRTRPARCRRSHTRLQRCRLLRRCHIRPASGKSRRRRWHWRRSCTPQGPCNRTRSRRPQQRRCQGLKQ